MLDLLCAEALSGAHDRYLAAGAWSSAPHPSVASAWTWSGINHRCNALLWDEEDKARRLDVGDAAIAAGKRLIDRYNQARNDAVEAVDEEILGLLGAPPQDGAVLHSETPGAMIDRLSILALKIHHMRVQARRADAAPGHRSACALKLERLIVQRLDLGRCFDRLLAEARQGRTYFKLYRQFKMYNDPALNPHLYGAGTRRPA